jgi:hypothetical protein
MTHARGEEVAHVWIQCTEWLWLESAFAAGKRLPRGELRYEFELERFERQRRQ